MNAPTTVTDPGRPPDPTGAHRPHQSPAGSKPQPIHPPIDVYEIEGYVIVEAALPGATSSDVKLICSPRNLQLSGRIGAFGDTNVRWHQRRIAVGPFAETIPLPVPVATGRAVAALAGGLLTVLLPKSGPSSTRPVRIRVDSTGRGN